MEFEKYEKLGLKIARLLAENRVPLGQLNNVFSIARGELCVTLRSEDPSAPESP